MSDATSTQSWPPADPAARREIPSSSTPLDQAKVEALLARIEGGEPPRRRLPGRLVVRGSTVIAGG